MKSLVHLLFFLIASLAQAQGWRQTFEGLLNPAGVCQTPDGGVGILANSIPGGPHGRQIVLSKTDQDGRLQWQKLFGQDSDDEGRSLILTADDHLAVAGKFSVVANNGDAFLTVFDLNGQKLWERIYNYGVLDDAKCVRQTPDGGFVLAVEADNQLRIVRVNAQGYELWSKAYPETQGLVVTQLELRTNGGFVVSLLRNNLPISAPAAVVLQLDASGNKESIVSLPHFSNFVTTNQVRCKPASDSTYWLMHRDSVYLLNRDSVVLKHLQVASPTESYLTDLIPAADGDFYVLGTNYSFSGTSFSRSYFARYGADGAEKWRQYYEAPNFLHSSWTAERCRDGGFVLTGNYAKNNRYFTYLLRTDSLGKAFSNELAGRVFWDKNNDCTASAAEPSLAGWLLKITLPNGDFQYATTDKNGWYRTEVGLGAYVVSVLLPNGLWSAMCVQDVNVLFDAPFQSDTLDFAIKSTGACPLPRVDAGIDYWLRCAENALSVRYSNSGTVVAENAAITLTLDTLLNVVGASVPFSQTGLHEWKFSLGNLPPLQDSSFRVDVQTDCSADLLNRTLCVSAAISPDAPCIAPLDGPLLVVEGHCEGDSVRFRVRNIGQSMTDPQPYIVVEDDIMFLPASGELQLASGEEWVISLPASGPTWRFEVLQAPNTPDWLSDAHVAAVVEGCSTTGGYSTGYGNQFSLYDGGYFSETECRPVVANAPGVEKVAYPAGWNAEHLVQPNTDLEYELHFQNTLGDSVRVLTLRDTLDHILLDPASILPGPASHAYAFDLSGSGVLTFQFLGAALPDSGRVWVKFRVRQRPDLAIGSIVHNRAWAYPDFRAPISTNETFHTIGAPLLTDTEDPTPSPKPGFRVWPVPTSAGLNMELPEPAAYICRLTDMTGRLILEQAFYGKSLSIQESALPAGIFYLNIYTGERRVEQVKVVKIDR